MISPQGGGAYAGLPFFPPFGPLPPLLALAYQQQYEVGGTSNPFLVHAPPAQTSNLTLPKPPATPAPETTRTLDYPEPRAIPEGKAVATPTMEGRGRSTQDTARGGQAGSPARSELQ